MSDLTQVNIGGLRPPLRPKRLEDGTYESSRYPEVLRSRALRRDLARAATAMESWHVDSGHADVVARTLRQDVLNKAAATEARSIIDAAPGPQFGESVTTIIPSAGHPHTESHAPTVSFRRAA